MRRRLARRALAVTGLHAATATVLAALLLPLLALGLAQDAGRALAFAALIAAGLGVMLAVVLGWLRPRRQLATDEAVARFVGAARPELSSDLLSAVQLGDPREAVRSRFSGQLVAALVDDTARRLDAVSAPALVDRSPLRRPAVGLATAAAVSGVFALVAPGVLAEGWARIGRSPADGPFGGAAMSDAPLVGDLEIRLTYPAYTGRPPQTLPSSSGDFRAMPGTAVEIHTRALVPAGTASLVFDGQREPVSVRLGEGASGKPGRALSASFVVADEGRYRFLIEAPGGERRVEVRARQIELEPDHSPEVQLYAPADELDVASLKRIELAYIVEDDFGIDQLDLVWQTGGKEQRKSIPLPDRDRRAAQGKFLWDLAEVALEPGERVPYHLEARDTDTIRGPNIGRSRTYHLRVFSPRERHEQNIAAQRAIFEHAVRALGGRLTLPIEDVRARAILHRDNAELVVELGTVVAALGEDELADDGLREALEAMRKRLDKLVKTETQLLERLGPAAAAPPSAAEQGRLAAFDRTAVAELEDDVLILADWIDRQQMENLLAISDEIKNHENRLRELLAEYERTGSPELLAEIQREMRALQQRLAELASERTSLDAEVLDRFVNVEALEADRAPDCMAEVAALLEAGDAKRAREKMDECMSIFDGAMDAMEQSLRSLRGDRFAQEEKAFGELMNELADITHDQRTIAEETADIWERYADRADEMMREEAKETQRRLSRTIDELRERLADIPENGLTPFSAEELEIVESRIDDLERMLGDGDIAEALAMAKQARTGLETMEAELDAAIADEAHAPWSKSTRRALRALGKAEPLANKLVEELEASTPSPEEIMGAGDRRRLERLRRRQRAAQSRAERLGQRAEQMAGELPGSAGQEMAAGLREATAQMKRAGQRMGERDPSSAREEAQGAADTLEETRKRAQGAARQQQQIGSSGLRDEPIRIPGADEYETPKEFREDILEAMKKEEAPEGFGEQVLRYYEDLIR